MRARPAAIAALAVLSLAACTATQSSPAPTPSASVAMMSTQADIGFAQSMIPHHQQAVEMADVALDPQSGASTQVQALATQIKAAQDPEIRQMNGWLQQWNAASTMPGMDHAAHSMTGPGMMTASQMRDLTQARGTDFDRMWLTMMIAHHKGAIAMAQQVQSSGNPQVTTLAEAIMTGQQQEIATMQAMLAGKH